MKKFLSFLKLCLVFVFILPLMYVLAACGSPKTCCEDKDECDIDCVCDEDCECREDCDICS